MKQVFSKFKLQVIKEQEHEYKSIKEKAIGPGEVTRICLDVLGIAKEPEEIFGLMTLDTKNNISGYFEVSRGSINSSIVHPREIYKRAITQNATSIILVHNHPSGETKPSHEDREITNRLAECGKILGINVIDHVIIGEQFENYYSFREEGLL